MFEQVYWPVGIKLTYPSMLSTDQKNKIMADFKAASEKAKKDTQVLVEQGYEKWHVYDLNTNHEHGAEQGIVFIMHKSEVPEPFGKLAVAYEEGYVDASNVLPPRVALAAHIVTKAREAKPFVHPKEELDELYEACLMVQADKRTPADLVANLKRDTLDIYEKLIAVNDVYDNEQDYLMALQDALAAIRPHLNAIVAHIEGRTLSTAKTASED